MRVPVIIDDTHIIKVDINLGNVSRNAVHDFLSKSRSNRDSHWKAIITEQPKGSINNTEDGKFLAERKSIILHRNVKLGEKRISRGASENIHYMGEWISMTL